MTQEQQVGINMTTTLDLLLDDIQSLQDWLEDCDPGQTRMEMREKLAIRKRQLEEETIKQA